MELRPPDDDPALNDPVPPSRTRRAVNVAILLLLIVSMVFLAYVSGRGVIAPPEAPGPTPRPSVDEATTEGRRLVLIDAAGRLATADPAGDDIVRYGDTSVVYSFPAWSPDGSYIAALGRGRDGTAIHVFEVRGSTESAAGVAILYESADEPPFYLYWSPDSRQVAFLTSAADGLSLRIAPADATAPATVVREGSPLYWAWTMDDARLLVHSGSGADEFFGAVTADGVPTETSPIDSTGFRAPAVTTDGRFRAYVAPGEGTPARIMIEEVDGPVRQALDIFGAAAINFGPATSELAFIAPSAQTRDASVPIGPLRSLDALTGDVRTLFAGPTVAFFWAPDGRTIAALELATPGNNPIAATSGIQLAAAEMAAIAPLAVGLALRLTFVDVASASVTAGRSVLVSDTFSGQVIPFFDQYALSHRFWSADGGSIVLPVVASDGTEELQVIPADGSEPRSLGPGVSASWHP
ncbi:MAG: hypothetical protein H0T59_07390 [Chloroflexi bacterium]|nr:hypothetical protein [Chloroflexota bacterium]